MRTGPELNDLLFLLPQQVKERLFGQLHEIDLLAGEVIRTTGSEVKFVYFPVSCITSLGYVTLDGHASELSVVGSEGVVGLSAFLGAGSETSRMIVQSAGTAYWMAATEFNSEVKNNARMRMLMLRYTLSRIIHISQTVVCNRHHTIDQQLCRWLLLCLDLSTTNELTVPLVLIGHMLDVRREGMIQATNRLEKLGIIRYQRGHIAVLDRPRLETLCCECYSVETKEIECLGVNRDLIRQSRRSEWTIH